LSATLQAAGLALDAEQLAAVTHPGGPALVLAGPGAGKTRVLTGRAAYLIKDCGVDPAAVVVCTFTTRATDEMRERLHALLGPRAGRLQLGTIHATCYRLLREHWRVRGDKPLSVLTEGAVRTLALMLLDPRSERNAIGLGLGERFVQARDLARFFWAARNRLLAPDEIEPEDVPKLVNGTGKDGDRWRAIGAACRACRLRPPAEEDWIEAYRRFQAAKQARAGLDFEDMAYLLWRMWEADPKALARDQARFAHVLIDEFQDTAYGQWQLLRRLAEPQQNVFCVGDADQSIYAFRGAEPQYIVSFRDYYPTAAVYPVATNYRSVPGVVRLSARVVRHNTQRVDIGLRPHRAHRPAPWLHLPQVSDASDEAGWIADDILRTASGRWQDVAVLYRTNSYSAGIELALLMQSIPYRIFGGCPFFRLAPAADMLAYLRLAEDPADQEAFERAVSSPSRYLGRAFFQETALRAGKGGNLLEAGLAVCPERQRRRLEDLAGLVSSLPAAPAQAIQAVREATGYDDWFLARSLDDDELEEDEGGQRVEALDRLVSVARSYDTRAELLAYVDLVLTVAADDTGEDERVTLCTIHRSKGLEWPTVYVAGLAQGILPHRNSLDSPEGMEEERRVFYVAVTRARDRLVLTYPSAFGRRPAAPSVFLREMGLVR
jgi:DNA helicase-2/ATP-dependent DNA helicase PcrA